MIESTVALIKPDGVAMGVADGIIKRYGEAGLKLVSAKFMRFGDKRAKAFYAEHEGKFYFPSLILAMTSGPLLALVLRGEGAIEKVREMNGATDPRKAAPGTIRHDFRSAGGPFNTVHGSDSAEAAEREMKIVLSN